MMSTDEILDCFRRWLSGEPLDSIEFKQAIASAIELIENEF